MGKGARDERPSAWGAGLDGKGPLRELRKNCYLTTGARVQRHRGRPCQDLGNPILLLRRAPVCEGEEVRLWARDCPCRQLLDDKMRRRL